MYWSDWALKIIRILNHSLNRLRCVRIIYSLPEDSSSGDKVAGWAINLNCERNIGIDKYVWK
jgi:hypothetical protein